MQSLKQTIERKCDIASERNSSARKVRCKPKTNLLLNLYIFFPLNSVVRFVVNRRKQLTVRNNKANNLKS